LTGFKKPGSIRKVFIKRVMLQSELIRNIGQQANGGFCGNGGQVEDRGLVAGGVVARQGPKGFKKNHREKGGNDESL
jgi:hypothetical protein